MGRNKILLCLLLCICMVLMCVACGAEYTISYELNGGINAEANPSTYVKSKEDIVLADPTKNGYIFAGWAEGNIISAKSKEDKVFTATWSAITYNIKYELNGGTLSTPNPSTYTIESPSINLTSPTKLGYKFAGWAEGNGIMSGSTGDKIFTATWELNTYNIIYNLDGGIGASTNPTTYSVESVDITLINPTKTGYTFNGWAEGINAIASGSTGDKTFTATWELNTYNIIYNLDGGLNAESNPASYTILNSDIVLADPTKLGNKFMGWAEGDTITGGSTGDKVFTAVWDCYSYDITYVLGGGTNASTNPTTYNVESQITLDDPTKTGYTFDCWTEGNTIAVGSTGNKTFTATWCANSSKITLNGNGSTSTTMSDVDCTYDEDTQLPTNTYILDTHHYFAGWATTSTGDVVYEDNATVINLTAEADGEVTLYAVFKYIEYTVTYQTEGGSNIASSKVNSSFTTARPTDPTKADCVLAYWLINGQEYDFSTAVTSNITLTASWITGTAGLSYSDNGDGTVSVNGIGNASTTDIYVPATVYGGIKVTAIAERAFNDNSGAITSIYFGDNVTSIGAYAFYRCTNLTQIDISDSITSIAEGAFYYCQGLKTANMGNGITTISDKLFYSCGLTQFTVPDNVTYIGADAFSFNYNLLSFTIGTGLQDIGFSAFYNCNRLVEVYNLSSYTGRINYDILDTYTSLATPSKLSITEDNNFVVRTNGAEVTIITYLSSEEDVVIPNNITEINRCAFYKLAHIKTVTIPNTVSAIGEYAFYECTALTSITVPNSVTHIGSYAIYNCSCDIYFEATYEDASGFASSWDSNFKGTCHFGYPLSYVKGADSYTLNGTTDDSITTLLIADKCCGTPVTAIAEGAFMDNKNLTTVFIPASVTTIGADAFSGCSNITIYCEADNKPTGFADTWANGTECTIIWDCNNYQYTIDFDVVGGDAVAPLYVDFTLDFDAVATAPTAPTKEGFTFVKWLLNGQEFDFSTHIVSDLTLVADWQAHTYTTEFNANGGAETSMDAVDCTYGTSFTIPANTFTKDYYYFVGWATTASGDVAYLDMANASNFTSTDNATVTLYAVWKPIVYNINYNLNGGTNADSNPTTYTVESETIILNKATHYFYLDMAWDTETITQGSYGDITITANWEYTHGLEIAVNPDYCSVVGIGTATDTDLIIPLEYEGKPVKEINYNAFKDNTTITSLRVSDIVTRIYNNAFSGCTSLASFYVSPSAGALNLLYKAFYGCTALKSVTFSKNTTTSDSSYVFSNCPIEEIHYAGTIADWCTLTWNYKCNPIGNGGDFYVLDENGEYYFITDVVVPEAVTDIPNYMLYGCDQITSVTLPNTLQTIGAYAFYGCQMTTIDFLDSYLTSIEQGAFSNCTKLTYAQLPASVQTIGESAFDGCDLTGDLYIKSNVSSVGSCAFRNNEKLTGIYIGSNVTTISSSTFFGCSGVKTLNIMGIITSVDSYAFYRMNNIETIYYSGTAEDWNNINFQDASSSNPTITSPSATLYVKDR